MAKWLMNNPEYRVIVLADGGASKGESWADTHSFFGSETYQNRLISRFNQFKLAVEKAGGGNIPANSMLLNPGTPAGSRFNFNPIRR
jgi:hypothetical protein